MTTSLTYPTGGDYREALFDTRRCFKDPVLTGGAPVLDGLGMPKPISGAFGSVFTIRGGDGRSWAVKCFTRGVTDQAVRYQRITEVLAPVVKPWRVAFEYVPEGVLCKGVWYPVLKMEWVDARGLIPYVEAHLWRPTVLGELASSFAAMVADLERLGVAHGDLQHGNLLVTPAGELKLIDYDGMFVPGLESFGASEIGHVNYQSPARTLETWGPHLDRFSAWLIYASLVALTVNPALWTLLHAEGDEALLFHKADFLRPGGSPALGALERSSDPNLRALARAIEPLWSMEPCDLPPLDPKAAPEPGRRTLTAANGTRPAPAGGLTADDVAAAVAAWQASAAAAGPGAPAEPAGERPAWLISHLPTPQPSEFAPRDPVVRALVAGWAAFAVLIVVLGVVGLPPLPVALAGVVATAGVAAAGAWSLSRTAEWRAKHEQRRAYRQARAAADGANRSVARAERGLRAVDRDEREALDDLARRAAEARAGEQDELAAIERRSTVQRSELDWRRQSVESEETWEFGNALRLLQEDHVRRNLRAAQVRGAPGMGPMVAARLAVHGITSAADFVGISIARTRGGGHDIWIDRGDGQPVRVNGIGEQRAESLETWRRTIEARARASQPSTLPPEQAMAIRRKHVPHRQSLVSQEHAARSEAVQAEHWARERWAARHADLVGEAARRRQELAEARVAAEALLATARREAADAEWREQLAARGVIAYRPVTPGRYLVSVLRG